MKRFLILLAALLFLAGAAAAELPSSLTEVEAAAFEGDRALTGVLTLPDSIEAVAGRAFAETGLHALIVPEGCRTLAGDVLADSPAVYVTIRGTSTQITDDMLADVSFVFAPLDSAVSSLSGYYAAEALSTQEGIIYSISDEEAIPLCAAEPMAGEVILPKLVNGQPLRQLDSMVLRGCEDVAFAVPSYLIIPDGMTATTYAAMTVSTPVADVAECSAGDPVTWTVEVDGAYGDVSYVWLFDTNGSVSSVITAVPEVTWNPTTEGVCVASVTAVDSLNDKAFASGQGVTVGPAIPVYRALLVGNTYPGTDNKLDGCDTDVYAMRSVLGSMSGTDFAITTRINVTAGEIQSAIASTFDGARPCDVSLFYFSGHGSDNGSLVGIGNSAVSVGALRNWLDKIPGTKIVIIDCCYSGRMIGKSEGSFSPSSFNSAFISGFSSFTKANNLANNGYVVMTACSMSQVSTSLTSTDNDGTKISFGAFTYGVCYGSGYDEWSQSAIGYMPADDDGDGQITLGEAYSQAVEEVAWLNSLLSESKKMEQEAQYYGDTDFVLWVQ